MIVSIGALHMYLPDNIRISEDELSVIESGKVSQIVKRLTNETDESLYKRFIEMQIEEQIQRRLESDSQSINNIISIIVPILFFVLVYILSAFYSD